MNYIKGDLFDTPDKVIIHGCNTSGVMGSGVAKLIKEKYPKAFEDYEKYIKEKIWYDGYQPQNLIGLINISEQDDNKVIINAFTQEKYGKDGKKYVSYDAISNCFKKINMYCLKKQIYSISIPKIGAGLGGGNWEVISTIIKFEMDPRITVNVYEL